MTFSRIFKKLYRAFDFCQAGRDESYQVHFFEHIPDLPEPFCAMLESQHNVFLQPAYLKTLEDSSPLDMHFAYACVEKNGSPVAFLYFQLLMIRLDNADGFLNPRFFSEELAGLSRGKNNIFLKSIFNTPLCIMFCGNVFVSGEHGIYINPKTHNDDFIDALPPLMDEIIERAGLSGKIAGVVIKDFYEQTASGIRILERDGYKKFYFEPDMVLMLRPAWHSFDDYLNDLSSKYRVRVRNVFKRSEEIVVKELTAMDIQENEETIETLYKNVLHKSAVHFSAINASYFTGLKNKLKNNFSFKSLYLKNRMVAFSTMIYGIEYSEAHLVGIDYELNKTHSLYPFILYQYISDAIARKAGVIHFGRTALEIKSTLGAKAFPLHCYLGLQPPLSAKMLSPFFNIKEKEIILRDPFKEAKNEMNVEVDLKK